MRILALANNWLAWQCISWLRQQDEEIVGVVVHPNERQRFGREIIDAAQVPGSAVIRGDRLRDPRTLESVRTLNADIAVSILFDYILEPEFIQLFPEGVINLHPSYLPYNRGQYPNVWSIVEGTPAGVSLHYIDEGIDTGDVIARMCVPVAPTDTGESLYRRLERAGLDLFCATWPSIRSGSAPRLPQSEGAGTYHRTRDVDRIDEIDLDRHYRAGDLIDILRARTFPPYAGAYFRHGDRKIYMRLQLISEDDLREENGGTDDPH